MTGITHEDLRKMRIGWPRSYKKNYAKWYKRELKRRINESGLLGGYQADYPTIASDTILEIASRSIRESPEFMAACIHRLAQMNLQLEEQRATGGKDHPAGNHA